MKTAHMTVTTWGTRGSLPVSGESFAHHGGDTTSYLLELHHPGPHTPTRIIIDGGTGLAAMGRYLGPITSETLVVQSHLHWDHLQGYPFFAPFFCAENKFRLLSASHDGIWLEDALKAQMKRPLFPLRLAELPARLYFERLPAGGSMTLGELEISWTALHHPSGSTGYRFRYRGTTIAISGDVEVRRGSRQDLVDLAQGADLLVMDAQYFDEEYQYRRGYGHSTLSDAVEVAAEASVSRLLFTHHDPTHNDTRLDEKAKIGETYALELGLSAQDLAIANAKDNLSIELGLDESKPIQARELA